MFKKILIANRGEIACRIARTARRMNIATVAVFSDADASARHVELCDEAFHIGAAPARDSYLRGEVILEVTRRSGAEAVHPGYGFLSENAAFAEACAAAGIVFIGPPAQAIRAMGSKSAAKALMARSGVPLVPGYHGDAQAPNLLAEEATRIGYPVLIKASAGGGGKGMRIVTEAASFAEALASAKREAASSFGDDHVLVERYLQRPRHIEIQVFADSHGNCVSLFERDCSIQRRHQKVVEEAPAPGLSEADRRAMGDAAIAAAQAVGYVGAGTVEFIREGDAFYFMEMNTRLQVEHPVTEKITGLDLVEWQLRVAAGQTLPLRAEQLRIDGHAIEVRVYAEDPARDFLPSIGTLTHLRQPSETVHVRVDTGVRMGDRISVDYDPMIAKLIVWDHDRAGAVRQLATALADYEVAGVQTNLGLLTAIATSPAFMAADLDTSFITRHIIAPEGTADAAPPDWAIGAAVLQTLLERQHPDASPWAQSDGWQMNLPATQSLTLRHGTHEMNFEIAGGGPYRLEIAGMAHVLSGRIAEGALLVRLDEAQRRCSVLGEPDRIRVYAGGSAWTFERVDPLTPPQAEVAGAGKIVAPIPGRVTRVMVAIGDAVTRGQALVMIEAMKMELTLTAAMAGEVAELRCAVGEMVEEGVELVLLTSQPAS